VLAQLREERSRLDGAIEAFARAKFSNSIAESRVRFGSSGASSYHRQRAGLTAAGRKRLSDLMKQRWAEKKKLQSTQRGKDN
jgi:hypothetical protein